MEIINRISLLLAGREQKELTNYLGLKSVAFSEWKSGKSKSYRKYLIEIAEFFNVSLDYLVYGKENQATTLKTDEQALLDNYRQLADASKKELSSKAEELANGVASETNENRQGVFKPVYYSDLREKEMLMLFRSLSEHEQAKLIGRAELLVEQDEFKKNIG